MANILIVDDDAINRKLLVSLVCHYGHDAIEAKDGLDALDMARAHRPELVISDIVMPSMDGFGFVRALRADPALRDTRVIFYTAIYHEREAARLARECQVAHVLVKPSEPAVLLTAIKQALSSAPPRIVPRPRDDFDRQHVTLLGNKLSEKSNALEAANARLLALQELNILLTSDRDPQLLLERVCAGARRLIGCRFALLAAVDGTGSHTRFAAANGIAFSAALPPPALDAGPLGGVVAQRRPWRAHTGNGMPLDCGLPPGYPPIRSVLAVPLVTNARALGWLCLADKIGADSFDAEDERFLGSLAEMGGRLYEICAWQSVRLGEMELLQHQEERFRERLEDQDLHLKRLHTLLRAMLVLTAQMGTRQALHDGACRLLVTEGCMDLAFIVARDGDLDSGDPLSGDLRTVAAAGNLTDLPQDQSRESSSLRFLVASVIDSLHPVICNELRDASEYLVFHQMLFRKGYRALAVLPLTANATIGGCLVLASRRPDAFDAAEMRLLGSVVDAIALTSARLAPTSSHAA